MEDNQSFLDLQVDEATGTQLVETSRWAKLLAILVLSITGIFAILFIAVWNNIGSMANPYGAEDATNINTLKGVLLFCVIIGVVIAVILMIFLLKGAKAMRSALIHKDQAMFNTGLAHFRNYLAMMGILSLIMLMFMFLAFSFN